MSTLNFTPGPWVESQKYKSLPYPYTILATDTDGAGDIICHAPEKEYSSSLARWPANARLICAAPEMYAILEEILMGDGMQDGTLAKINQLFIKLNQ